VTATVAPAAAAFGFDEMKDDVKEVISDIDGLMEKSRSMEGEMGDHLRRHLEFGRVEASLLLDEVGELETKGVADAEIASSNLLEDIRLRIGQMQQVSESTLEDLSGRLQRQTAGGEIIGDRIYYGFWSSEKAPIRLIEGSFVPAKAAAHAVSVFGSSFGTSNPEETYLVCFSDGEELFRSYGAPSGGKGTRFQIPMRQITDWPVAEPEILPCHIRRTTAKGAPWALALWLTPLRAGTYTVDLTVTGTRWVQSSDVMSFQGATGDRHNNCASSSGKIPMPSKKPDDPKIGNKYLVSLASPEPHHCMPAERCGGYWEGCGRCGPNTGCWTTSSAGDVTTVHTNAKSGDQTFLVGYVYRELVEKPPTKLRLRSPLDDYLQLLKRQQELLGENPTVAEGNADLLAAQEERIAALEGREGEFEIADGGLATVMLPEPYSAAVVQGQVCGGKTFKVIVTKEKTAADKGRSKRQAKRQGATEVSEPVVISTADEQGTLVDEVHFAVRCPKEG